MPALKRSPLAPAQFPNCLPVPGIEFATVSTGMRYKGRPDLLLVRAGEGATAAGVFTRSKMPSAPVEWSKAALSATKGRCRGIVVNAGNANAFTGKAGDRAAAATADAFAAGLGCAANAVLLASTGVIGEPLDPAPIIAGMKDITWGGSDWLAAARAIGTTDTFPKGASALARIDGEAVVITGIAKGSGMIAPDMATMLGFVFTNAAIAADVLHSLLAEAADKSFNAITVDGDTSTSDTLFCFAAGHARHRPIRSKDDPRLADFRMQLLALMTDLAHQIVKDGEGAEKFVTIRVSGAESDTAARAIGLAIANSPLIKTAIAGADPNWGRIIMAIGKSGERADRDRLKIHLGGQCVAADGRRHPDYSEPRAAGHMKGSDIRIDVDVAIGEGAATVWTCDLTHGYISINADYRS